MRVRLLALLAVLVFPIVAVAPAGAGGGGGGGPCTGFTKGAEILMKDSCFHGVAHIARPGTITVTNGGNQNHNIVAVDGSFGVKGVAPGTHYEFTVDRPGVYEYYCAFHGSASGAGMAGVLVVQDGPALAAARTADAALAPNVANTSANAATNTVSQPKSAWGWVALAALLLAGGALCVSLAVVRPRHT
jgi:plastocyanin